MKTPAQPFRLTAPALGALVTLAILAVIAAAAPPNATCPLMLGDAADPEYRVTYQGREILLCCGACEKQWNRNPDYYAAAAHGLKLLPQLADVKLPATVKLLEQRFCPFTTNRLVGPESPAVEHRGVRVHFSKAAHAARWQADPERHAREAAARGLLPQLRLPPP